MELATAHNEPSPCGPIGQGVWLRIRRLGVQVPPGIVFWGISSIGRVRALQARGTGIETLMLHFEPFFFFIVWKIKVLFTPITWENQCTSKTNYNNIFVLIPQTSKDFNGPRKQWKSEIIFCEMTDTTRRSWSRSSFSKKTNCKLYRVLFHSRIRMDCCNIKQAINLRD